MKNIGVQIKPLNPHKKISMAAWMEDRVYSSEPEKKTRNTCRQTERGVAVTLLLTKKLQKTSTLVVNKQPRRQRLRIYALLDPSKRKMQCRTVKMHVFVWMKDQSR